MLTDHERRALLAIARDAIAAAINGGGRAGLPPLPLPDASGVFVTLKKHGQLRGCLGTLELQRGLAEEVARCAADSATEDPRFSPVAAVELADLVVEISVLGAARGHSGRAPRPSPSANTGWSSSTTDAAACCCRRSPRNGSGPPRSSSRTPA